MKRVLRLIFCLICLGGLLIGCAAPQNAPVTAAVARGTVTQTIAQTGLVVYDEQIAVTPIVSGKILSCLMEEGDAVQAGQTLYRIDCTELDDQIARAALSLSAAQESLAQAQSACEDLTVPSFVSGLVTAVYCNEGDYVTAAAPIARVVDSAALTLTVPFHTAEIAALTVGDSVTVGVEGSAETLAGSVTRIYDGPVMLDGNRSATYAEISVQNPGGLMKDTAAWAQGNGICSITSAPLAYKTEQDIYATQSGQVLLLSIAQGDAVQKNQTVMTIKNSTVTNAAANAAIARDSAEVTLAQLQRRQADYVICAPADGVVFSRIQQAGDFAAPASVMAVLAVENAVSVEVGIDELYIEQIWPGQTAQITFTTAAGEEKAYAAQVHRVSDAGITAGGVTDYTVQLKLTHTEGLKAGMNVRTVITAAQKTDCLYIPNGAVTGGAVRILQGGTVREQQVETGISGGGYTEILSGLTEGELVVLDHP